MLVDHSRRAASVLPIRSASRNPDSEHGLMDSLQCKNLVKHYGRRRVVDEVSLRMEPGEVVGLLGANGAGKTTTFYMIVGLERPDSGSVLLGEQDLTKLPMYLRARLGIGYLPQEPSVFRKMTAAQNILAVLETVGLRRREQLKRLEELLEEFGIAHVRNTRGDALSGGERRRTEIARALATEPHYILLDEPRSEEHTSELQSQSNLVCRLLLEKKKKNKQQSTTPMQINKTRRLTSGKPTSIL